MSHDTDGRIDVLVHSAGIIRDDRVDSISNEDWDAMISVNLTAAFYGIRAVIPG